MPGTYNPGLNYFIFTIKEKNGQFEHITEVVVEATDITEAKVKAKRIVQTWYKANPYCCGFIFLFKDEVSVEVEAVVLITSVSKMIIFDTFYERGFVPSLILSCQNQP